MESLGIALAAVALVALGTIAAFAIKLVAAHADLARLRNENYALQQSGEQRRVALADLERERNKAVTYATTIENELMSLASTAGEPVVRARLHQIWADRIRAVGGASARAVSHPPAANPVVDGHGPPVVLGGGTVPDYHEFAVSGAPAISARPGALDIARMATMFARKK